MRTKDLQVGEVYAVAPSGSWREDHAERVIVLEAGGWSKTTRATRYGFGGRGFGRQLGGNDVAVALSQKYDGQGDWTPAVIRPNAIRSTWAQYEADRKARREAQAKEAARKDQLSTSNKERTDAVKADLESLGIDNLWMLGSGYDGNVALSISQVEQLIALAKAGSEVVA